MNGGESVPSAARSLCEPVLPAHNGQSGSPSIYREFLQRFLDAGYTFTDFEGITSGDHKVVMHHDIDGDPEFALKIAQVERELDIKSYYFFMTHSKMYNLCAYQGLLFQLQGLGRKVGLHYDPDRSFYWQKQLFEEIFDQEIEGDMISIHRPKFPVMESHITHTYEDKYFKDVEYVSDSQGMWKYGTPFERDAFKEGKNMHILTHPTWWFVPGGIKGFVDYSMEKIKEIVEEVHG